ncbi:MAG: NAD(P)/FAD-dependent oxidoreductase [Alphaproteobacteria bacterium]|nr:NAD(P)/FAD-dependent oxidoreductase [Alphaproteobacteria bacterium]MBV9693952.1 NAD(P)/FAD-dependent oxidoreductase [Alphaproteobacteria bacterium]
MSAAAKPQDRSAEVEWALKDAHIPSLMMALVHLTGDASHLTPEMKPVYDFFGDGQGGFSEEKRQWVRDKAKAAILNYLDGKPLPPPPDAATIRKMMDFIAGADIPERYVPFLKEELGIAVEDSREVKWDAPKLKQAAAKMNVVIVGAGLSGLLTAIRLSQAGVPFTIIEKNPDVGGTWYENAYPGCRVDNPNHMYSYSFEPNHAFPYHFSTQDVLHDYFRRIAEKYDLRQHIRFESQVVEAAFDGKTSHWKVLIRDKNGREETLEASAVISAVGQLNQPKMPDIKGIGSFKGPAFHTARWRHDVDLKGKRVAVIGTGATAFQVIPEIAPQVGKLLVFQRSAPWLGPTPNYHDKVAEGKKWLLEHVPTYGKWYRFWLFWTLTDGILDAVAVDPSWNDTSRAVSPMNEMLRGMLIEKIKEQLPGRPDLVDKVVPDYPFGSKRSVRDNGVYLAALARPNVDLITTGIDEITPKGIRTKDGGEHEVDVIVYGTGFHASDFLRTYKIVGRDGVELHERWKGDARAYLGMTVPGFPNFFVIYGPNTNIVVNGSIIFFTEASVRYIVNCLKLLAESGARTMEVKADVHDAFNARVDAENAKMAWGVPNAKSWYKNTLGRVSQNWPFKLVDYWNATIKPDPKDFVVE